jgi:tripartite-type tricarboxylate transporter receptor subunit TctC
VPADRVAALRQAFQATLRDSEFQQDVKTSRIDVDGPTDGAAVEALIRQLYATPKRVVDRVTELRTRMD